jgi:hypothetical protein
MRTSDPPALIALRRAAKNALKLAIQTGTGYYVMENGKIGDIARSKKRRKRT